MGTKAQLTVKEKLKVTFCQLPSASSQDPVKVGQLNLISWTYN